MKAWATGFLVPLLTIALYSVGVAAETAATKSAPPAGTTKSEPKKAKKAKPATKRFSGEISALDSKSGTLAVKSTVSEKNFVAQEAVKESLERMTVGDRVKIIYTEKEGKLYASSARRLKVKNAATTKPQKESMKPGKESATPSKAPAKDSSK